MGDPCGLKAKATRTPVLSATAPTVCGHLVLQGQAGDASGSEVPSEPIFILPLPCHFQGGKIEDNGLGLGSNSTV